MLIVNANRNKGRWVFRLPFPFALPVLRGLSFIGKTCYNRTEHTEGRETPLPLLTPQFDFRRIQEIPTSFFAQHGIRALLLDVDNTLTGDNSQEVKPEVAEWLARQQQA
ncbi:MAG: hypothetical protein J6J90_06280, partial [Angelakisella sp.]|nr:hypothetical protein [Angelakisella sp.]